MTRLAIVITIGLFVALTSSRASADLTYNPGPGIQLGDIQHQTLEYYPEPRDRTVIGIGESVSMWVDEPYDEDEMVMEGTYLVPDDSVEVIWEAQGEGVVYPIVGYYTELTADLAASDNTITVVAIADDDGMMGDDPAVQKNVDVDDKVPTGIHVWGKQDQGFAGYSEDASGDKIGMFTTFYLQVKPTNVNLSTVNIQEITAALQEEWPNGDPLTQAGNILDPVKPILKEFEAEGGTIQVINFLLDDVGSAIPYDRDLLKNPTTGNYDQFDYTWDLSYRYFDKNNQSHLFHNGKNKRNYTAGTSKGQATSIQDNTLIGGEQGPWKKNNP